MPENLKNIQVCTRCLYDTTLPDITFDDEGVCNYCKLHDELETQYPAGDAGRKLLEAMAKEIRRSARDRPYDCVIGVSGGCDSSFLLFKMVELGLRPLAVHFDNTWNSPIATQNIYRVTTKLGVDLSTHVVNNKEIDDIYRAFLVSGVNELDVATDMALVATTCQAAEKHGLKYVMEGHSFRTEGISPLGGAYTDGRYLQSVHEKYGTRPLRTLPQLTFWNFMRWSVVCGIKRLRPLYYIDYHKEDAKQFLADEFGWEWYGGHHQDNRIPGFRQTYVANLKGEDKRIFGHAALVRSGQLDREEARRQLAEPRSCQPEIVRLVKKRLGFSDEELHAAIHQTPRHYSEFYTYKKRFERLKWFFWVLYKLDRVPKSFYYKYCC